MKRAIAERKDYDLNISEKIELIFNSSRLLVNNEEVHLGNEKLPSYNGRLYIPFSAIEVYQKHLRLNLFKTKRNKITLNHVIYHILVNF
ncbi:hypothetical protein KHA80_12705 [Anaerobacillus sp. HL2]|nr:hypothetical protein KHA80_12705 [Anaerobacillus sp. HL2]